MSLDAHPIIAAIEGGALIGLAAGGLYLATGRIAGVSGIFGDSFLRTPGAWRWLFVAGLVLAGLGARLLGFPLPADLGGSPVVLAIAGLLVGFGTRLGNGCTSGHGVCGLARLSIRSLAAVIVFMLAAALTVYLTRHVVSVPRRRGIVEAGLALVMGSAVLVALPFFIGRSAGADLHGQAVADGDRSQALKRIAETARCRQVVMRWLNSMATWPRPVDGFGISLGLGQVLRFQAIFNRVGSGVTPALLVSRHIIPGQCGDVVTRYIASG